MRLQHFYSWLRIMQQLRFFQKSSFFLSSPSQRLVFWNKSIFSNWNKALPLKTQRTWWNHPFLVKKKKKIKVFKKLLLTSKANTKQITRQHFCATLIRKKEHNLRNQQALSKTTFFKQPKKITWQQIFSWIRLAQKKNRFRKKNQYPSSVKKKKKTNFKKTRCLLSLIFS